MELITQLIRSLDKGEIQLIRRYYDLGRKKEYLLREKLFEIILSEKDVTREKIEIRLKRKPIGPAFNMLVKRLTDDILKILIIAPGTNKFVSKFYEGKYRCRRMIVEIDVLRNKGISDPIVLNRIFKAERLAKKFELSNEKIIINEYKKDILGLSKGLSAFADASKDNVANFKDIMDKSSAEEYFRRLTTPNLFSTNKEINYIDQAKGATEQLKILSESNPSAKIRYWYLRSKIFYCHLMNDYSTAELFAYEFLQLIQSNRIVNSSDAMGGAHMLLTVINIYLGNAEKAIEYAKQGLPYFHKGSTNEVSLNDNLFQGYLILKNYSAANEVVNYVTGIKAVKSNQFLYSKWMYFRANLLFHQKHFDDCLAILQKQSEITSDKSGWRLGYKILEMMCIIEMGNYDWLDYRIETFRKLLSVVKKENIHRPKVVMAIIKQFIKSAYDFKLTTRKMEEQLKLLEDGNDQYRYDPKGYEVIRFDAWWKSKVERKASAR